MERRIEVQGPAQCDCLSLYLTQSWGIDMDIESMHIAGSEVRHKDANLIQDCDESDGMNGARESKGRTPCA